VLIEKCGVFMKKNIFILLFFVAGITAQNKINYFPGELNIQPFIGNTLEPKIGTVFQIANNELELNIGNSLDIFQIENKIGKFSAGVDFFTFTLLRSESNFHFPVDAVDYLFGVNFGFKANLENNFITEIGFRLRLSHISAHFVDGHWDNTSTGTWRDGRMPMVYSREFVEFLPFMKIKNFRFYAGFTYLYHVDPSTIKKDNYQAGFDFTYRLMDNLFLFSGYDLKIIHLSDYSANHNINIGFKFGKQKGRGISFFYEYYSGKSYHGEYFNVEQKFSAFGFNIDL